MAESLSSETPGSPAAVGSFFSGSRPRRFGKRLLVSTLEAHFRVLETIPFPGVCVIRLDEFANLLNC